MKRGTRVGQAYVAITADGDGINEEIVDSVDKAGPEIDKSAKKQGKRYSDRFAKTLEDLPEKVSKKLDSALGFEMEETGTRSGDRFGKSFGKSLGKSLAKNIGEELEIVIARQLDLFEQARAEVSGNDDGGGGSGGIGRGRGSNIGSRTGRLFGAGSRNDALNLFGRTLGGVVGLIDKAQKGAAFLFTTFKTGFNTAAEGASTFQKILSGGSAVGEQVGLMMSRLVKSGPAAVVAILAIVAALSVMASIMEALLGIVTAFASTILTSLVGGLFVLSGAIGAVVVAGGLLTAAFMSMTDAQKALLKDAFEPLHAEMIGLGQIMLQQMVPAFDTWSAHLQQALLLAAPVAAVMGKAFADAGNIITSSLSGPGFQNLSAALSTYLPNIVTTLATALGGFLNGLTGAFAIILPYVLQFSNYLGQVAERFSRWANSTQGQNSIVDFMERAMASIKSLWGAIREISGFIGDVLFSPEAQAAGMRLFDGIRDTFERYRDAVAQAAADGSLQEWFDTAIEFGSALWAVIESLGNAFIALSDSGVLGMITGGLEALAFVINIVSGAFTDFESQVAPIAGALSVMLGPVVEATRAWGALGSAVQWAKDLLGGAEDSINPSGGTANSSVPSEKRAGGTVFKMPSLGGLIGSGRKALSGTTKDTDKFVNPYKEMAEKLIKEAPSLAEGFKRAIYTIRDAINAVLRESATSLDATQVRSGIREQAKSLIEDAQAAVKTAQDAVSSAASTLAGASSADAAENALRKLKSTQKDLKAAQANQLTVNKTAKILAAQQYTNQSRIKYLVRGFLHEAATLTDYSSARSWIAGKLEKANERLTAAIAMRDDYKNQVTDAANAFGSIMTTQAQTLGGIEQALTVTDITTNLQTRLDKIRKFQEDLRVLSSQGLSQAAYKQIVDAGVDDGSRFTEALLSGGAQAVQQVNDLVSQIGDVSGTLGTETSNRMYQAGVDAANGLIAGLTSQQAKLDAAAFRLGNAIAKAVRKSLGIKSPSTRLMDDMDYAGDGLAKGLSRQEVKVGAAAEALADRISVHARTSVTGGDGASAAVSGNPNGAKFRDLIINTPTEDPHAVTMEVLNEVTGRL